MAKYEVKSVDLHKPSANDVVQALQKSLETNFAHVKVEVVDSPDLRNAPFHLTAEGLCGSPRIADVGGVKNLEPVAKKDQIFNTREVAKKCDLPHALMIGPGGGPFREIGVNCELMANSYFGADGKEKLENYVAKVDEKGNAVQIKHVGSSEFALMGNFLISEGKPGKVIKVVARKRTGEENFVTCMRLGLKDAFGNKPVSLGGCFLIEKGKATLHVMPDFSPCPLPTPRDTDKWLRYFEMSSPLICLSVFHSQDPGLDLRIEHTHCFSTHGEGGHYHYDTTPEVVEYVGYFVIAERLYKID